MADSMNIFVLRTRYEVSNEIMAHARITLAVGEMYMNTLFYDTNERTKKYNTIRLSVRSSLVKCDVQWDPCSSNVEEVYHNQFCERISCDFRRETT